MSQIDPADGGPPSPLALIESDHAASASPWNASAFHAEAKPFFVYLQAAVAPSYLGRAVLEILALALLVMLMSARSKMAQAPQSGL